MTGFNISDVERRMHDDPNRFVEAHRTCFMVPCPYCEVPRDLSCQSKWGPLAWTSPHGERVAARFDQLQP